MQIPKETIENVRERIDIAEVVSRHVELRRAGSNLRGLCPFHQEKTPSFFVSPDRQTFHCFGCDKGGNVFTFVMEMEGVSFPEAVRSLGRRCGVEVAERRESPEQHSRNEARYGANAFAADFYRRCLNDSKTGAPARRYFTDRGIPQSAWGRFELGYAPDGWDGLWREARRAGIAEAVLAELRLVTKSDKSKGYFDYFRNRIMFPIRTASRRVVAFGGRVLAKDAEPKYLNSAESPIFAKRRTFYGLVQARDAIRKRRRAIVVEGYTDLIALHVGGLEHTLAACGTAVTAEHAAVLRRMTRRAVLVPDADQAGVTASLVAGAVLLGVGLDVAVARLPRGADPDSAMRDMGTEKFSQLVETPVDYFEYLDYILTKGAFSLRDREALIRRIVDGVNQSSDAIRRDVVTGELARVFGVEVESLRRQHRRSGSGAGGAGSGQGAGRRAGGGGGNGDHEAAAGDAGVDRGRVALEKLALRLILDGSVPALSVLDILDSDDFRDARCREMYKTLDVAVERRIDLRSREYQRLTEEAGLEGLAAEVATTPIPPGNAEILLTDTVRRIKELRIRDELSALSDKLRQLPAESEEAVAVVEYYRKLKQALVEL